MGGKRKSDGSVATRDGRWYAVITLRPGSKPPRHWKRIDDGAALDKGDAKAIARQLQKSYDAGAWDPRVPVAPTPAAAASGFFDYVHTWVAAQGYATAAREARAVARYVVDCPVAHVAVAAFRPRHAAALVAHLKGRPSRRGGVISGSMVATTFNACARALDHALVEELLPTNPLRLPAIVAKLPEKADKVAGARATWRFTLSEIAALTRDARVPEDRRVLYALVFWTGCRPGEFRALRFRDLDWDAPEMPRLTLARAIKVDSHVEGATKTGAIKEVPVLPPLAAILRRWAAAGWAAKMRRAPSPDDLVVPSTRGRRKGEPRNQSTANRTFRADQAALGFAAPRHMYAARHTFVRMLRDASAVRDVTRWATHAPPRAVLDNYAAAPAWGTQVAEFAKLLPGLAAAGVDVSVDATEETPMESNGSTAESKRYAEVGTRQHAPGSTDPTLAHTDVPDALALTPSTLGEAGRLAESALHAWGDALIFADSEALWN